MAEKLAHSKKYSWMFTRYFRAGVYGWNGSALASRRINEATTEIKKVAKKDPVLAAKGAGLFIEKCWRALEHIDSSSGTIGNAVNNALIQLADVIGNAELSSKDRQKLIERIWESWQDEDYGYYDVLTGLWPQLCAEPEIMNYWVDLFLPIVRDVFKSTVPGSYFKGSEPCLACLFNMGRYDEIIDIVRSDKKPMFFYQKYVIKVVAARGDIERALLMIDECLSDSYSSYQAASLGEEVLIKNGRIEEAYKRYAFLMPLRTTGLATFTALQKKYPTIPPQRILNDLLDTDPGNERRYFATARKIGMIECAVEIAEKYDVEPKTLTTASKDYVEKDPNLSLKFGLIALQRYADGFGYEPEYTDVQRCHEIVCLAAVNAGKREDTLARVHAIAHTDKSKGRLVLMVVNSGQTFADNIVPFRPRR